MRVNGCYISLVCYILTKEFFNLSYSPPEKQVQEFSDQALDKIRELNLPPSPENYELWFVYFVGAEPTMNAALDRIISKCGGKISNDQCYDVFQAFLSELREGRTVRKAGDQIQKTILDVNEAVASVHQQAENYTENLTDVTDKLSAGDKTQEELGEIVSGAVSSTSEMIEHNQGLKNMLTESIAAVEDMRRDLEIARKEAMTDSLTGLANRKAFDQEITRLIEQANSEAEPSTFSLIMVDIDHFKNFNDKFGHQVGDQVLKLVARTFLESVKGRDLAVRYGGEEFAILLPETQSQGGLKVAELLRKEVENKDVINRTTGKRIAKITLSGGVSQYVKGESANMLVERVDSALYKAKNSGRNKIVAAKS